MTSFSDVLKGTRFNGNVVVLSTAVTVALSGGRLEVKLPNTASFDCVLSVLKSIEEWVQPLPDKPLPQVNHLCTSTTVQCPPALAQMVRVHFVNKMWIIATGDFASGFCWSINHLRGGVVVLRPKALFAGVATTVIENKKVWTKPFNPDGD